MSSHTSQARRAQARARLAQLMAWLAGAPDLGFVAVAAWTGICLIVHLAQILQGLATPRGQVVSWLSR